VVFQARNIDPSQNMSVAVLRGVCAQRGSNQRATRMRRSWAITAIGVETRGRREPCTGLRADDCTPRPADACRANCCKCQASSDRRAMRTKASLRPADPGRQRRHALGPTFELPCGHHAGPAYQPNIQLDDRQSPQGLFSSTPSRSPRKPGMGCSHSCVPARSQNSKV